MFVPYFNIINGQSLTQSLRPSSVPLTTDVVPASFVANSTAIDLSPWNPIVWCGIPYRVILSVPWDFIMCLQEYYTMLTEEIMAWTQKFLPPQNLS